MATKATRLSDATLSAMEYLTTIGVNKGSETEALAALIESHRWQRKFVGEITSWRLRQPWWKRRIVLWLGVPV